jgi:hypothetical protein
MMADTAARNSRTRRQASDSSGKATCMAEGKRSASIGRALSSAVARDGSQGPRATRAMMSDQSRSCSYSDPSRLRSLIADTAAAAACLILWSRTLIMRSNAECAR